MKDQPQRPHMSVAEAVQTFRLLADPVRLRLLLLLAVEGERTVTALHQALDQSQPSISHHLALLRMGGLVESRREGKHSFYSLSSEHVRHLLEAVRP
jgi:ArsR family transcriptional regulator